MVAEAARCGASAVKFQKRTNETLYTQALLDKAYDHEHSYGSTYGEHRRVLELSAADLLRIRAAAHGHGIHCFATAFDERAADALQGQEAIELASGAFTDQPLLRYVANLGMPVILSTGGGTIHDIDRAHDLLHHCPHALLHCTAAYPLAPAEANLRMILTLRERYPDTVIGFSSHSPGI